MPSLLLHFLGADLVAFTTFWIWRPPILSNAPHAAFFRHLGNTTKEESGNNIGE